MTNRGWPRRVAVGALALLLLIDPVAAPLAHAQQGRAPSAEDLRVARELFQEAYRDEQEKRFAQALEKFQRVAAVKESGSVRYRIGSVLASLGRLREARDAYRALAASRRTLAANEQEIADSAAERAQALDRRIPRIVVKLQESPTSEPRVTIDGSSVPAGAVPRAFEVDPGEHLVQATAEGSEPYETKVGLLEGAEVAVTVLLRPAVKPAPVAAVIVPPPPDTAPRRDNTLGLVALGAGGLLVATGIIVLAVREGEISDLKSECRDVCPSEKRAALESTHDEAKRFGPLGVGFGVAGALVAGVGAYLVFRPGRPAGGAAHATTPSTVRFGPRAVRGGAGMAFGATF